METSKSGVGNENVLRELSQTACGNSLTTLPPCRWMLVLVVAMKKQHGARRTQKSALSASAPDRRMHRLNLVALHLLGIKTSTAEELDELKQWGVTDAQLELSIKDERLGPRGSLAAATRLPRDSRAAT